MQTVLYFAGFVVVALSAYLIGKSFTRLSLPYITGYLVAGALVGPFILNLLPAEAVPHLRFVDQIALAIIAFVAGSELFLKEVRQRLHSIVYSSVGIILTGVVLGSLAVFLLTGLLPFTADRPVVERIVIALLGAVVLLALSPPSTIAVIKEARAKGPFTRTILSVTVFMDVAVVVIFAVATSLASVMLTDASFDAAFLGRLAIDLAAAVALGLLTGALLNGILSQRWGSLAKTILIVALGYGVYFLADQVKVWSVAQVGFEIYIEPLLICLIGGFTITNFTPHRERFDEILHTVGTPIYVAFFTLTGMALQLDILIQTLPYALALFAARVIGIYAGAWMGGRLAHETDLYQKYAWMGYVSQAGIGLGLAREVAVQFPSLGTAFATLIISVIVLNQVFGPLLLKYALRSVGESNLPGDLKDIDPVRDALILGVEPQSVALARELQAHGWRVILADTDESHVRALAATDIDERHVAEFNKATLGDLITQNTDAVVLMLDDDEESLRICAYAQDRYNISRIIARVNNVANLDRFAELRVFVVDPTSALISLLEQAVLAPQSAALMMYQDPSQYRISQITVTNPDLDRLMVRDLRLPADVLILSIQRNGDSIVPNGYTPIHVRDDVTLVGKPDSIEEATIKLGY